MMRRMIPAAAAVIVSCCLFLPPSRAGESAAPAVADAIIPEVVVKTTKLEKVGITFQMSGRATAYLVAEVRPQVNGIIQKRLFEEGTDVKGGEPLYQIDPSMYSAQLDRARAILAKDDANAEVSKAKEARYAALVKEKAVSREDYDEVAAAAKQAAAEVNVGKADVTIAQINLDYTKVFAPISGRIGKSSVTVGALVTASQPDALATIQQLDPIYVDVTQSTAGVRALKRVLAEGRLERTGQSYGEVGLVLDDGEPYPAKGKLLFAESSVEQSTGTIGIRLEFPNPNHDLLPGMYVKARIGVTSKEAFISVPQQAVTRDASGEASVLVVAPDGTVSKRKVTTTQSVGDNYVLKDGLSEGEKVVVEGSQRIRFLPGSPPPRSKP